MTHEIVSQNFGKAYNGWWWAVWQGERLVGFGTGYRSKRRSFTHENECAARAMAGKLLTVECQSNVIEKPRWMLSK